VTDTRPILFFDSGVGGLSVLAPTAKLLPQASLVYAADSAGFPYGTRSEAEIAARVPALLGRLAERYDPRLIVIACNTASTIALQHVRAALDVPIVGTVPAIKPAAEISRTRTIGVLGTEATVRQPYVDDLASRFASDCTVLRHGSAALVTMGEAALAGARPSVEVVVEARGAKWAARSAARGRDRRDRQRLHALPTARAGAGGRHGWAGAVRGWRTRHRAEDRLSDARPNLA
jgi:glutamate racemase